MRKGFAALSLLVQEVLRCDPLSGHLFCFRGRRGDLLKVIWHDGSGSLPVHEAIGTGPFFMAESVGWQFCFAVADEYDSVSL
jgi:transposase